MKNNVDEAGFLKKKQGKRKVDGTLRFPMSCPVADVPLLRKPLVLALVMNGGKCTPQQASVAECWSRDSFFTNFGLVRADW